MKSELDDDRADLIDLISRTLAENNEWAADGEVYGDPHEWRVEATHVLNALLDYRWIVLAEAGPEMCDAAYVAGCALFLCEDEFNHEGPHYASVGDRAEGCIAWPADEHPSDEAPVAASDRNAYSLETKAARARRIAADPDAASDADKLRAIADLMDLDDERLGRTGTEAQTFMRRLADHLDPVGSATTR